jgi:hypothetical protein
VRSGKIFEMCLKNKNKESKGKEKTKREIKSPRKRFSLLKREGSLLLLGGFWNKKERKNLAN